MSATRDAPKTIEDLKQLLQYDLKVKVAGTFHSSVYVRALFTFASQVLMVSTNVHESQYYLTVNTCSRRNPAGQVYGAPSLLSLRP